MFSWCVAHVFSEWLWIVPVAPIITGITFVFTFHMRCISIVRSLYFRIFSASFLNTFLSPEIATSINTHVPFSLSRIIMSGLLLGIVLSVSLLLLLSSSSSLYVMLRGTSWTFYNHPTDYKIFPLLRNLQLLFLTRHNTLLDPILNRFFAPSVFTS